MISNFGGSATSQQIDSGFVVMGDAIYEELAPPAQLASASRKPAAALTVNGKPLYIRGIDYSPQQNGVPIANAFSSNVLANSKSAQWTRDFANLRAMNVNAIRLYNVPPPQYDGGDPIDNALVAAWNGGTNPIYVVLSISIDGGQTLLNQGAVSSLITQYHDLAKRYAQYPAVLGITIGNELVNPSLAQNPAYWTAYNSIADSAKKGFSDGDDPSKLIFSAEIDDPTNDAPALAQNAKGHIDVLGINSYRGRSFTNFFSQYKALWSGPLVLTEYGASAATHPTLYAQLGQAYTVPQGIAPSTTVSCAVTTPGLTDAITDVAELPASGPVAMSGLVDLVTNLSTLLYSSHTTDGVSSGGFYFEYSDEWYKLHATGVTHTGAPDSPNVSYPGCWEDQGWYGLYRSDPDPAGSTLNVLTPRPTVQAITNVFAGEM